MKNKVYGWHKTIDIETAQGRIAAAYDNASASERLQGECWYLGARRYAEHLAKEFDLPTDVVCGVIAALSPGVKWSQNKRDAANVLMFPDATVSTYAAQRDKALVILDGGAEPLDVLQGPKERAFFLCILCEYTNAVCIDRHAVRVALGWDASPQDAAVWLKRAHVYELVSSAYKHVANLLALRPYQLQAITWLWYRDNIVPQRYRDTNDNVPF
jgi:hypothetical protein